MEIIEIDIASAQKHKIAGQVQDQSPRNSNATQTKSSFFHVLILSPWDFWPKLPIVCGLGK